MARHTTASVRDNDHTSTTPLLTQVSSTDEQSELVRETGAVAASESVAENGHPPPSRRTSLLWDGSTRSVLLASILLIAAGCSLGIWVAPKDMSLPTPWYRTVSAMLGYTYFLCWSVSFYPQVISNYQRKSTQGLSPDFCALNVLGFACYTAYNVSLFFSKDLQRVYEQRHHGANITIQTNDVAFAVHALLLSTCTLIQVGYYDGFRRQRPSKLVRYFFLGIGVTVGLAAPLSIALWHWATWLDYLYLLSYVKILISIFKYIPQVVLNYQRKSTVGWSISGILLDFSGGVLSDLQLVLDSIDAGDLYSGITGNLAKLGLGMVSIGFDIIFMWQHYILYPHSARYHQRSRRTAEDEEDNVAAVVDEDYLVS